MGDVDCESTSSASSRRLEEWYDRFREAGVGVRVTMGDGGPDF